MNQTVNEKLLDAANNRATQMQIISMVVVSGLLILTSLGNAGLMSWVSLGTMLVLAIWFAADRKVWLALVSSLAFIAGVLVFAKSLF